MASQVDIPEVFLWKGDPSCDHCWHTFDELESTDREATDPRTFEEFVQTVEKACASGWKEFKLVREPIL